MIWGYDVQAVRYTVYLALHETMSNRLRVTQPKLAGMGMGLELWRLLVRGHEAPEQPLIQRAHRQRWSFPTRCKDLAELRVRLPEWECWGRDLEAETGTPIEDIQKMLTLDQLVPLSCRLPWMIGMR